LPRSKDGCRATFWLCACALLIPALTFATRAIASPRVFPTGVTVYDPARAYNSFVCFSALDGRTHLVDMDGNQVHQWSHPGVPGVHRLINPAHVRYWSEGARLGHTLNQHADAEEAANGRKELARFLPVLESALTNADWLVADYSLADIAFAPHLGFLVQYGFDFAGAPRVRAWLERIRARPAWQEAQALIFDGYAP
jgi:hypothetical protein